MRHLQQTLVYSERSEDIATIAQALDCIREKNHDEAARVLTVYLDALQQAQRPRVVDYDPQAQRQ